MREPNPLEPEQIVRLDGDRVVLLDQRRLPGEVVELECRSAAEVAEAIRTLAIRGAPALGIAAAYGFALAAARGEDLQEAAEQLVDARPTAVNPHIQIAEMFEAGGDPGKLAERARELHGEEVERCRRMAEHALELFQPGSRPYVHCNTGALATAGYGSALGAVRRAWEEGLVESVIVGETRPLDQGARLTAWELEQAGVPFTVCVDSAAGALMSRGEVTHVLVGADRIAANGDTANKIGTYGLAVLASAHELPFIVVAPTTTLDGFASSGREIPIEERDGGEVTARFPSRNPAFDVTPAMLVDAIVTEDGVFRAPYDRFPKRVLIVSTHWEVEEE